jgi:outer membrane protein OmpA-like peptidoglycan-associated protein
MRFLKKIFFFTIATIILSSCSDLITKLDFYGNISIKNLASKESLLRSKNDYNSYLALEYLQFAKILSSGKGKSDAGYFATKGIKVSEGREVVPENPIKWKADRTQIEEMIVMQKRLQNVLTVYLKKQLPIQLAHLTYLYDCWITKESKPIFRANELAKCKTRFYSLLNEIEQYQDDIKKERQPKTDIIEPEFEMFEILFDLESFNINDRASKDLISIINYLSRLQGKYRLMLAAGIEQSQDVANQALANNRIEVIENYLVKNGVLRTSIEAKSVGQDFPDIITGESSWKKSGKIVRIYVLKGVNKSFLNYPLPLIENYMYRQEVKELKKERGLE